MKKIIERFDKYMEYKGLNDNKVTNNLNISVGLLGKSRKEGRDLSKNITEKILEYYTDLSSIWLLTGEGQMLKDSNQNIEVTDMDNERLIQQLQDEITELKKQLVICNENTTKLFIQNSNLQNVNNELIAVIIAGTKKDDNRMVG